MKPTKLTALLTAALIAASLTACSSGSDDSETTRSHEDETAAEAIESITDYEEPEYTEDYEEPALTYSEAVSPEGQTDIICYGEANDDNSKTYPLMGREHWCVEDDGVNAIGHHTWKYVDLDTGEVLGECFGYYDEPDAYIVDIDGDGVYELLCNVQYGADMAVRALIYRDNNGKLEMGDFDSFVYEDATGNVLWGAAYYDIVFDPYTNTFNLIDKNDNSRLEIGLKYYSYYDYEYVEY